MTRMSREFSLVLLGTGILSAGYFSAPSHEEELEQKAEAHAARQTGHTTTSHRVHTPLIWLHTPGYAGSYSGRSAAHPTVSRGGFGGAGRAVGASSGS